MGRKLINYTLPQIVFFDGNSHLGDGLEDRTVIMHIPSTTILEVIDLSEVKEFSFKQPTYEFEYMNRYAAFEKHMFVVHFSMLHDPGTPMDDQLKEQLKECAEWYCDYLAWEDNNIIDSDQ
jgi:hypothetical protein